MNNNNSAQEVPQWLKDEAEEFAGTGLDKMFFPKSFYHRYTGYVTAALKYAAKDEQVREEPTDIEQWVKEAEDALHEAITQIDYLHKKFKETGSGNTVIARGERVLFALAALSKGQAEPKEEEERKRLDITFKGSRVRFQDHEGGDFELPVVDAMREGWEGYVEKSNECIDLRNRISELEAENKQLREGQELVDLADLLCNVSQLLAGYMNDESWSEWDESVRQDVLKVQCRIEDIKGRTATDPRDNPLIGDDDSWIHDVDMGSR